MKSVITCVWILMIFIKVLCALWRLKRHIRNRHGLPSNLLAISLWRQTWKVMDSTSRACHASNMAKCTLPRWRGKPHGGTGMWSGLGGWESWLCREKYVPGQGTSTRRKAQTFSRAVSGLSAKAVWGWGRTGKPLEMSWERDGGPSQWAVEACYTAGSIFNRYSERDTLTFSRWPGLSLHVVFSNPELSLSMMVSGFKKVRADTARPLEASAEDLLKATSSPFCWSKQAQGSPDSKRRRNRVLLSMGGPSASHCKGAWTEGGMICWGPSYQTTTLLLIQTSIIASCKHLFTSLCRFLKIYTLNF